MFSNRKLLDVYDQNETSSPHNKIQQQQQEEEEEEEEEEEDELVYRFADPRNEIIEREYPDWEFEDHLSLFRLGGYNIYSIPLFINPINLLINIISYNFFLKKHTHQPNKQTN